MKLVEKEFVLNQINKYGSLMTVGNGYLGLRGSHEESYSNQIRGLYLNDVYNQGLGQVNAELVNLPDVLQTEIYFDNELFHLQAGTIEHYERTLDFSTGEVVREVIWISSKGERFHILSGRTASQKESSLLLHFIEITPLTQSTELKMVVGIDGQQTNFGTQHLIEKSQRVMGKHLLYAEYQTSQSQQQVAVSMQLNQEAVFFAKNRQLKGEISQSLAKDEVFRLEKIIKFNRKSDSEPKEELAKSYQEILASSVALWQDYWKNNRITIAGSSETDQLSADFALYHLAIMTPEAETKMSIGAKGLTGPGYKGHIFWDTEIFLLPFYLHTQPETAKQLLMYRYQRLEQAKMKAKSEGFEGALFPWESAVSGQEETPEYAAINIRTGKRQKVASAIGEHHIVADIAYGIGRYVESTGDTLFMENYGAEMLLETAKFWLSRSVEKAGKLIIQQVIGPDEYTEFVDNNAYTNYLAAYNVKEAIKYNPDDTDFIREATEFLEKLYLPKPNQQHIIPQDDSFMAKPVIDLSSYKKQQGKQGILLDYSRSEVNELQVLKQADVVMLHYLFPNLFSVETRKADLLFYEERTIHDSSLSKAIHSIEAIRLGESELGYRFFQEACLIDLGTDTGTSDEGIHAAAIGAIWLMIVFGFSGIQIEQAGLIIEPSLPEKWKALDFTFQWQGELINFHVTHKELHLTKKSTTTVLIKNNHQEYQLINELRIVRE